MAPANNSQRPARWFYRFVLVLLVLGLGLWLLYASTITCETPSVLQTSQCSVDEPVRRVAVIGAGSGGASAAYYINQFKDPCSRVNITVFERASYIGGRSTTVNAYDNPAEPVELGASIFVEVNKNLVSAARRFGLSTQSFRPSKSEELSDTLGVYDGLHWVFRTSESGWWNTVKILWKYGLAPIRTKSLMKKTVGSFLKMYEESNFPFRDLSQTAFDLGLTEATAATGEQFVQANGIPPPFTTDIIQASTRVNYAQNLDQIHGLESMVCMATDGAMSVQGGNWQIFDNMLKASGATVLLNTSVANVSRQQNGTYGIDFLTDHASPIQPSIYDSVILAAPLQFANISLTPPPLNPPPPIPYVQLHVTLFTSPHALNPSSFNLPSDDRVPTTILTTTNTKTNASTHPLPFYSISTLRTLTNPQTRKIEYLYKIFSPNPIAPAYLFSLLAPPLAGPATSRVPHDRYDKRDVSWIYEKVWHSYPYLPPRITFEDIQLDAEGKVWYTSGIESFISTMETSSLMGMNVARLVVDGWREKVSNGRVGTRPEGDNPVVEGIGDVENVSNEL